MNSARRSRTQNIDDQVNHLYRPMQYTPDASTATVRARVNSSLVIRRQGSVACVFNGHDRSKMLDAKRRSARLALNATLIRSDGRSRALNRGARTAPQIASPGGQSMSSVITDGRASQTRTAGEHKKNLRRRIRRADIARAVGFTPEWRARGGSSTEGALKAMLIAPPLRGLCCERPCRGTTPAKRINRPYVNVPDRQEANPGLNGQPCSAYGVAMTARAGPKWPASNRIAGVRFHHAYRHLQKSIDPPCREPDPERIADGEFRVQPRNGGHTDGQSVIVRRIRENGNLLHGPGAPPGKLAIRPRDRALLFLKPPAIACMKQEHIERIHMVVEGLVKMAPSGRTWRPYHDEPNSASHRPNSALRGIRKQGNPRHDSTTASPRSVLLVRNRRSVC